MKFHHDIPYLRLTKDVQVFFFNHQFFICNLADHAIIRSDPCSFADRISLAVGCLNDGAVPKAPPNDTDQFHLGKLLPLQRREVLRHVSLCGGNDNRFKRISSPFGIVLEERSGIFLFARRRRGGLLFRRGLRHGGLRFQRRRFRSHRRRRLSTAEQEHDKEQQAPLERGSSLHHGAPPFLGVACVEASWTGAPPSTAAKAVAEKLVSIKSRFCSVLGLPILMFETFTIRGSLLILSKKTPSA